ncbi:MAG: hypothetical protein QM484_09970 [Woeseiaceae bacterium]
MPRIVLADEPTANLDSENATALLDIMHALSHEEKTTFIFSTHDPRVMDRAVYKYRFKNTTVALGRQAIDWGSGRVWLPLNVFGHLPTSLTVRLRFYF